VFLLPDIRCLSPLNVKSLVCIGLLQALGTTSIVDGSFCFYTATWKVLGMKICFKITILVQVIARLSLASFTASNNVTNSDNPNNYW
jgi:hypothetical protein